MTKLMLNERILCMCLIVFFVSVCFVCWPESAYAASTKNKESIITNVKNPETGVIKYNVTVPAGEKIDYSVELTPDKKSGALDKITGSWQNKTRKTIKKAITVNVKFLSNKYKIKASYSKESLEEEILYKDEDSAVSALKNSAVTAKAAWDFDKLGKGDKDWKYRYKYEPYKNGFKKYLQIFNEDGKRIKNYVKQNVSITKVTKLIDEMKAR